MRISHSLALAAVLLCSSAAALRAQAITVVSAASFEVEPGVAPDSIASAFGESLAPTTEVATETPLPTELAGVSLELTDSAGVKHLCPLFFVSPGQINFLVPPGAALGAGTVATVGSAGAAQGLVGQVVIVKVAPGLFFDGDRLAAAQVLRVKADGTQVFEPTLTRDAQGALVPVVLEMSPGGDESDQIYLIVFGTGLRGHDGLETLRSLVGAAPNPALHGVETLFLGPQGAFAGLDQGNIGPLSRNLEWLGGGIRKIRIDIAELSSNEVSIAVAPNPNAPVLSNLIVEQGEVPQGFALFADVDFTDADADLDQPTLSLILEDERRFCLIEGFIPDSRVAGMSQGTLSFGFLQQGVVLFLGEITSVTLSIGDSGGHVSNIASFMPAPGALGSERFSCTTVIRKDEAPTPESAAFASEDVGRKSAGAATVF